jgi:hypothetical protein
MARTRVVLKGAGMRALLKDAGVVGHLEDRMDNVLAEAVANAPVDTGAYVDSLHLETVEHPTRTVVRVVADVEHALAVEATTGNLSRALDAAGGRA